MIRNHLLMFAMLLTIGIVSGCQGTRQQQVLSPVYSGGIASSGPSVLTGENANFGGTVPAPPSSSGSCQSCR